jgi:NTE family protein
MQPLERDGRILIDGAAMNPLPFDHLLGTADVIMAIDCLASPLRLPGIPDPWETVFATVQLIGRTLLAHKLARHEPDLVIQPNVGAFRILDFMRASAILRAADPIKAEVKERVGALLG